MRGRVAQDEGEMGEKTAGVYMDLRVFPKYLCIIYIYIYIHICEMLVYHRFLSITRCLFFNMVLIFQPRIHGD